MFAYSSSSWVGGGGEVVVECVEKSVLAGSVGVGGAK